MRSLLAFLIVLAAPAAAGPISKFDNNKPTARYVTATAIAEVERCLIDLDGWPLPVTYRQPDRPDRVTLMWSVSDKALGRVDLATSGNQTTVTAWIKSDQLERCAPKAATLP